jgi:protein-S-isoprenylcysteine O-methyltransferase Ste14
LTERSRALRRLRVPLGFLVGILYFWFAPRLGGMTPVTLAVGAAIALVHTRNPLYFGSFLIGCGFAIAAHWALLLAVVVFFYAVYKPVIASEQDFISRKYPAEYAEWARHVPAFFPRVTPWRSGNDGATGAGAEPFSFPLYLRHREWQAGLVYIVAVAWLTFRLQRGF